MAGKGDKRRPGDTQKYRDEYDRIFGVDSEKSSTERGGIFKKKPKRGRRHERGCPALLAWDIPDACRCARRYSG